METVKRKNGQIKHRESLYLGRRKINGPWFDRKTDATKWKQREETEKQSRLALGENFYLVQEIKFSDYAKRWMDNHTKINCGLKTQQNYQSVITNHLDPRFGTMNLRDIREEHGLDFMRKLKTTHNPKGIHNIWGVVKGILRSAKRERLILVDPFEHIKKPRLNLRDDTFWVKDELNQFLKFNRDDSLYPLYFVAIHTGLRMSELCGLCWDRINFGTNLISVTRTRDKNGLKDTTKTKLKRVIPMTIEVRSMLISLSKCSQSRFVFTEDNRQEVDYGHLYRRFGKSQKLAGITNIIRFHDLRHSFASNFMMNGGQLFELQKILGHTDIKMTMRYAHFNPEHLQSSLKFMNFSDEDNANIPVLDPRDFSDAQKIEILRKFG